METLKRLAYKAQMHIALASGALEARMNDRVLLPLPGLNGEKLYLTGMAELTQRTAMLETLYEKIPVHHAYAATVLLVLILAFIGIILGIIGKAESEKFYAFAYIGIILNIVAVIATSGILYAGAYGL